MDSIRRNVWLVIIHIEFQKKFMMIVDFLNDFPLNYVSMMIYIGHFAIVRRE